MECTLRIAVDPLFPPPSDWPKSKKYLVAEDAWNGKFSLIFEGKEEKMEINDCESSGEDWDKYD